MPSVGKNIPHDSARGHVSGTSIYVDDTPFAKNELLVDFYGSPVSHGKIKSIDLTEAYKVPGVVALFTHKDIDGENKFGPIIKDEWLLVEEICEFIGHPIVVIAAENRKALREAKKAIKVDIEVLEAIFTIDQAKARSLFIGAKAVLKRGNLQDAFEKTDHVLEGTFYSGGQDHFYLESQAAIAYPEEQGYLSVLSSTQNPSEVQEVIAHILGIPYNQVACVTKRMGGGFGGKECQATHPAAMASLVAYKTKRIARICLIKDDDMQATGKRHPFQNDYKVGFNKDGLITALDVKLFSDGGCAADLSTAVMGRAMTHVDNAYYIPNIEVVGTVCKTNFPPNTAFRGFGGPQGVVTIENIIEEIAVFLKKDPLEIRILNCYGIKDRNTTHYGEVVEHNMLPRLFKELTESSDYKSRLQRVKDFNSGSKTHLKGISLIPVKFGISFNTKFLNQGNALVNIYRDGTIQVATGATEMGQGVNTKIKQIVSDEFAIDPSFVIVMPTSTEKNNNTSATAASSACDINGSAAVDACRKLRDNLCNIACSYFASLEDGPIVTKEDIIFENNHVFYKGDPKRALTFKDLVNRAYHERVSLGEKGFYATKGIDFSWETGVGNPFLYYTMGCAVSEVLIDRFTGDVRVLRADILMDIGKPINPGIDRGQITGAFIQGMGWVTTEELRYAEDGTLLTHSPTTYKIPNIQDTPAIFNVDCIDNDTNRVNLRASKAAGEPPLLLAISVWTAIKQAISFVSNGQIPKLKLPATNEEILGRILHYQVQAPQTVPPNTVV